MTKFSPTWTTQVSPAPRTTTHLYAAPDGEVLAYCYTRVPMVVISESGDWREVQLGSDVDGLRCWVRAADLAFGADTENVVCTFPRMRKLIGRRRRCPSAARRFLGERLRMVDDWHHGRWRLSDDVRG